MTIYHGVVKVNTPRKNFIVIRMGFYVLRRQMFDFCVIKKNLFFSYFVTGMLVQVTFEVCFGHMNQYSPPPLHLIFQKAWIVIFYETRTRDIWSKVFSYIFDFMKLFRKHKANISWMETNEFTFIPWCSDTFYFIFVAQIFSTLHIYLKHYSTTSFEGKCHGK